VREFLERKKKRVREFEETKERERQMGHNKKRPQLMTIYSIN